MRINLNKEIGKEAINSYLEILNKQDKLNKYKEISTNKNLYPKKVLCLECSRYFIVKKWFLGENKKVFCYCSLCGRNNKKEGVLRSV